MKYKNLVVMACALAMTAMLGGCGKDEASVPEETVSPSATVEPTAEPSMVPDSVDEWDENTGDVTAPQYSVDPGSGSAFDMDGEDKTGQTSDRENGDSTHDSSVGEDMKRAGEDLGDAVDDVGRSIGDAMDGADGSAKDGSTNENGKTANGQ